MAGRRVSLDAKALMRPPAVDDAAPADYERGLGEDPYWNTWRGLVAIAAAGLGAFGIVTIMSIGLPFFVGAHLLLIAAVWLRQGPWRMQVGLGCILLLIIWWPATLTALAGAAPVLLAWAAYRRIRARRGRAWDGSTWPWPVTVASVAAGAATLVALIVLLSD